MLEHKIYVVFSFLSGPVVGIFGGAGPPVLRGMMSKIVSSDDQGKLTLSGNREQNGSKFSLPQLIPIIPLQSTCSILHELGDLSRPDWSRAMVDKS